MLKYIILPFVAISVACVKPQIKEVYIPTKCETPEQVKPKREATEDFTDYQIRLRAYYKAIESDLHFCRTGKRIQKPP